MTEPFTREEVERFNVGHDSSIIKRLASQLLGMMDGPEAALAAADAHPAYLDYGCNDGPPPPLEERRRLCEQFKERSKRFKLVPVTADAHTADQLKEVKEALEKLSGWLVCGVSGVASDADMAQSFSKMYEATENALATLNRMLGE